MVLQRFSDHKCLGQDFYLNAEVGRIYSDDLIVGLIPQELLQIMDTILTGHDFRANIIYSIMVVQKL